MKQWIFCTAPEVRLRISVALWWHLLLMLLTSTLMLFLETSLLLHCSLGFSSGLLAKVDASSRLWEWRRAEPCRVHSVGWQRASSIGMLLLLLLLLLVLTLSLHLLLLRSLSVEHLINSLLFCHCIVSLPLRVDGIISLPVTLLFGSSVFFEPHSLFARTMHVSQYRHAIIDRAVVRMMGSIELLRGRLCERRILLLLYAIRVRMQGLRCLVRST